MNDDRQRGRCLLPRQTNRFVIGHENNVVRVDFSRDPDPPAPRFPGASGLREIGDESANETKAYRQQR
jgi:hypothetical protein